MRRIVSVFLTVVLLLSCASMAEKRRLTKFEDTTEAYRRTLLAGDFSGAAFFLDPSRRAAGTDFQKYRLIRIVEYKLSGLEIDQDRRKIEQTVALQYYFLNINRLQYIEYRQVWLYNEEGKIWLLQTDLPDFDR